MHKHLKDTCFRKVLSVYKNEVFMLFDVEIHSQVGKDVL